MKGAVGIQDFKSLELRLSEDSEFPHFVFFKEHCVREQSEGRPSGRTLFVINVPPYADETGLSNAFSEAGKVQSVTLCSKPGPIESKEDDDSFFDEPPPASFKVAYVVFEKVSELHKALNLKSLKPMNSETHRIKTGMEKWIEEYNGSVLTNKEMKKQIEDFMKVHDKKTEEAEKKEKLLEQADEDGWVTVTKKGKVQSFARSEKVENKIMAKEEVGKKRKELKNFYRFQIRESKMKHIVSLRQKFEEDKKKIAQIKQSRRFKPF